MGDSRTYNESETRFYLIDPILREKGYDDHQWLKLKTPASVEPTGSKGRLCCIGPARVLEFQQGK